MRKRINISIDPTTYDELTKVQEQYGFATLCEMLEALTHIMTDHMKPPEDRAFDLNEDDNAIIEGMFDNLHKKAAAPKPPVPGRPKKATTAAAPKTEAASGTVKRKVGRPRKTPIEG
jgi:hypothetical protein